MSDYSDLVLGGNTPKNDGVHYWWMSDSQSLRHDSLFSRLGRVAVYSMAQLGYLKDLQLGALNKYYRDKTKSAIGEIEVPLAFSALQKVAPDTIVVFNGDVGSSGRHIEGAFQLQVIRSDFDVRFTLVFGVVSGIMSLWVNHTEPIRCLLPDSFSMSDFITLYSGDWESLEKFVIENGVMTGVLRLRIEKFGL